MKNYIDLFIGIDPSINSTGITIIEYNSTYDDNNKLFNYIYKKKTFFAIKDKLTKKEISLIENYNNINKNNDFNIELYVKARQDQDLTSSDNEIIKTSNLRNIINSIKKIIKLYIRNIKDLKSTKQVRCYVTIEANSYGSSGRTVSLIELAGLNYLIRNAIFDLNEENSNISYGLFIEPPTVIKKFATSRGDADKDLMLYCFSLKNENIYNNLKEFKLDDIADSYFMALYGLTMTYEVSLLENYKFIYNKEQSSELDNQLKSYKETKQSSKKTKKYQKQVIQSEINQISTSTESFIENI